MRCLNSLPVLNVLEKNLCESISADASHVALINPGDGRLARALREVLDSRDVTFTLVEPRRRLHRYLDDFTDVGEDPWDADWLEQRAKQHGPFDSLIFYQLNEIWRGEISSFRRILDLLSPAGRCTVCFVNSSAFRFLEPDLPPVAVTPQALVHPLRTDARIDYNNWLALSAILDARLHSIWGLLDKEAYEFCQNAKEAKTIKLQRKGLTVEISSIADAFYWGASVVAFETGRPQSGAAESQTRFSLVPYQDFQFQSILLPYPDLYEAEADILTSEREAAAWKANPVNEIGNLVSFFVSEMESANTVESVLVIGCGWGKDVILFKRERPRWKWFGADPSKRRLEIGAEFLAAEGIETKAIDPEEALPFQDGEFDVVISAGYFSRIHPPLARHVAAEALRVARKAVFSLENKRGPQAALSLKRYSLVDVFQSIGAEPSTKPVLANQKPTDLYLLWVLK